MKLIELHILQSFPVSCLNRDDVGAPKTATFGGATRARISSQCLKRAIREYAKDEFPEARFGGSRSRLIIEPLRDAIQGEGVQPEEAQKLAALVADELAGLDSTTVDKKTGAAKDGKKPRVGTVIFLSKAEINALATKVASLARDGKKLDNKTIVKACKDAPLSDAADIAIFGRMVAKGSDLTLEGAAMFSHALSTHRADNDIDFFSAVDDQKPKEEDAGTAHINVLEFTSAVYYRYAAVNLGLLADSDHLKKLSADELRAVLDGFIRSTILAVPGARKNSMNAHTLPSYVLGLVREKGQPIQLINAFEKPVSSKHGFMVESISKLKEHHEQLKTTWGINPIVEIAIPDRPLDKFCEEILSHV